jgi:hypothetical protein
MVVVGICVGIALVLTLLVVVRSPRRRGTLSGADLSRFEAERAAALQAGQQAHYFGGMGF